MKRIQIIFTLLVLLCVVRSSDAPGEVVVIAKAKGLNTIKTVIPVK